MQPYIMLLPDFIYCSTISSQLRDFQSAHSEELAAIARTVEQAVEKVENNVNWMESNFESIRIWLEKENQEPRRIQITTNIVLIVIVI